LRCGYQKLAALGNRICGNDESVGDKCAAGRSVKQSRRVRRKVKEIAVDIVDTFQPPSFGFEVAGLFRGNRAIPPRRY
jgi:hypothetical protein